MPPPSCWTAFRRLPAPDRLAVPSFCIRDGGMPKLPPVLRAVPSDRTATGISGSVGRMPATEPASPGRLALRAKLGYPGPRGLDLLAQRCAVRRRHGCSSVRDRTRDVHGAPNPGRRAVPTNPVSPAEARNFLRRLISKNRSTGCAGHIRLFPAFTSACSAAASSPRSFEAVEFTQFPCPRTPPAPERRMKSWGNSAIGSFSVLRFLKRASSKNLKSRSAPAAVRRIIRQRETGR